MKREGNNVSIFKIEKIPIFAHGAPKFGFGDGKKWGKKYMKREGKLFVLTNCWGGPTPFLPIEKCVFSHFFPWGKKYMEREGNEYFSLSFHILFFPFFPMGENGKTHIFPWAKWGWTPPPPHCCTLLSMFSAF